uniref:Major sperm protein n=1 Tax=Caenorhabditis tropicalis TaxID=1561998 RepID=A0A1I7TUY3_9PELO
MIEGSKYQSNHQFIVQAMPAPGDFADRKLIWKQPNFLGILTNTRVRTMRPGQSLAKSKSPSTPTDSSGMNSPALMDSSESLVTPPPVPNWDKVATSIDHGQFADNINDLAAKVKKAISEKNTKTSEMVAVVNQIKSIEVELDRQAQLVNELNERVKKGEMQYSNLVMHERSIRAEMDRFKNNDSEHSGP